MIRGSGSLEAAVRAQAERRGVDVHFLGFLAADELAAAYNAATCFVHAGDVETFGLTVAEAMACGRPVVAVGSGTLPEVLGETGVLAPSDDPARFARALAVELFSLERMGREYAEALGAARA